MYIGYFVSLRDGDLGGGGKRTIRLKAKKQKSSSCDDSNSRKGPRVRDNETFVLYFDTRPFFIGQRTSLLPYQSTTRKLIRNRKCLAIK